MTERSYASVWDALSETPEEAENMKMRSALMSAIGAEVKSWALPATEAASRLAITRPRLSDLLNGKIAKFSLDALVVLSVRAGLAPRMDVARAA
jgi:predicted XRE-type DNA-binding protein